MVKIGDFIGNGVVYGYVVWIDGDWLGVEGDGLDTSVINVNDIEHLESNE